MEGGHEVTPVFTLVREDEGLEQVTDSGEGEEATDSEMSRGRIHSPR